MEGSDDGVEAGGDERAHVQDRSNVCAPAPDAASAALRAAVSVERRDADEGRESAFVPRVPSSGASDSSVRERTLPTPGTLRSRSSFSRQAGEPSRPCRGRCRSPRAASGAT